MANLKDYQDRVRTLQGRFEQLKQSL